MADEPQRFCLGIGYMPGPDPRITKGADGGRDWISESELEKAAWSFLRNGPQVNAFHMAGTEGCATVVESSIHRGPDWDLGDGVVVTKGTWLVGAILDDRMWQAAQDGKVNGWSPEGTARRRKVQKEEAVTVAKSAMPGEVEDEFTELVGADFPTMGLVGKGANGIPRWLVMKNAEGEASGLFDAGYVRDLIGKQAGDEPQSGRERAELPNGITLTGSPAAMAAFIHKASQRQPDPVAKAKYDAADRKRMAANGQAMKDESYPIGDKDDLGNAIHAVGRGGADHDAIRRHIISRAKSLGASGEIPDNWASDGGIKEGSVSKTVSDAVTKDDGLGPELDDGADGMDPTVPLAEPDEMGAGDPTDPGSPAWESIDAATARKWTSIAVRFKNALGILAEREMLEAASADPDDLENAWDLEDAQCALDYVIGTLAGFAVDEQAEADLCGEAMEAIGKAMAGFDPAPLDVIEGLCAVRKSGRVLSAANEQEIRNANASLAKVLASLPAPIPDDGQPVAKQKETTVTATATEPVAKDTAPAAGEQAVSAEPVTAGDSPGREVAKSALTLVFNRDRTLAGVTDSAAIVTQVAKADGDGEKKAMQAVFDQDGDLIGIVDPDAIQPVTGAGGNSAADATADDTSMTPQPPAEAGTPADAVSDDSVTKQDQDAQATRDVLKSIVAEALAEHLGAQGPAEDIAKQADVAGLAQQVGKLAAELAVVKEQPAAPRVFTNGQVPPAHQLRGQDQGAPQQVNVAKAQELKREMYTADPARAKQISDELNQMAIAGISALHGR